MPLHRWGECWLCLPIALGYPPWAAGEHCVNASEAWADAGTGPHLPQPRVRATLETSGPTERTKKEYEGISVRDDASERAA